MIDLHLHLDGSLTSEDICYLARLNNKNITNEDLANLKVKDDCPSLKEYLNCFDLPLSLLQNKKSIEYAFSSLVNRLAFLKYIYVEIRFAPLLHTKEGLTIDEVVESAIKGLNRGLKGNSELKANIILCMMRHASYEENLETVLAAYKYKNQKVVAIDLAGDETLKPVTEFALLLKKANELGLNITIHAGEATTSKEVSDAINLGAKRIGHGVHFDLTEENIALVKNKRIGFEICPTSNLQTKSIKTYKDNPIIKFLDNDILVSLNSDNMTVSNTDVYLEAKHLKDNFLLTKDQYAKLLLNAIDMAFISEEEKNKLKIKIKENIIHFMLCIK
ncbi:MAG: adenosine deaminase [Bacilli bacterium]